VVVSDVTLESTRTVTQAEFAAWTAQRRRAGETSHIELMNRRIVMTPPAGHPHGEIENRIGTLLGAHVRACALGRVFGSSQGFELPSGDTVEPDAAFVSNARWAAAPVPVEGEFLKVVPDLVVEILSTSTASRDRGEKKAIYERNGMREYWLVDARAREVVVFVLEGDRYGAEVIVSENGRMTSRVVAGLAFDARDVFPS
jgi:Uma2 family endonuclease